MTKHYSSLQHIINLQVGQLVVMIHTTSVSRNGTLSIFYQFQIILNSCIITQDIGQIICMIQCKCPCLTLTFYATMTKNATVQFHFAVHSLDNHCITLRIHIQIHHNPPRSPVHHLKEETMHALVEQIKVALLLSGYL